VSATAPRCMYEEESRAANRDSSFSCFEIRNGVWARYEVGGKGESLLQLLCAMPT